MLIPGQVKIGLDHRPTTAAHPSALTLNGDGKIVQCVFGGFTKLEQGALMMAAALVQPVMQAAVVGDLSGEEWQQDQSNANMDRAAKWILERAPQLAVAAAFAVLSETEKVQQQMAEAAQQAAGKPSKLAT